ncbi:hypothetical protein [Mangrovimonas xylaniphaga]|uniref:hypothetical protein n=1 Tax=Mangrovimonas xylaniphaga TaxID=1645915 RepID=UPI0006B478FB|nr:hypothetical protein [Mangrovimonas xylaniphaga]
MRLLAILAAKYRLTTNYMKLQHTEDFLRKFDYDYLRQDNQLIVKMEPSQQVSIDFSNPQQPVITNELTRWNFLTGIFNMRIKNAVLLNFGLGLILSLLLATQNLETGISVFLIYTIWISFWAAHYLSKSNTLKENLNHWNN